MESQNLNTSNGFSHPKSGFPWVAGEGMLGKGGGEGRGQENRREFSL